MCIRITLLGLSPDRDDEEAVSKKVIPFSVPEATPRPGKNSPHRPERGDTAEIEDAEKIVPIATVQNRYSLADRRHEETLTYCERRGFGFLPWYPIAAGKLLNPDHPAAQAFGRIAAR